MISVRVQFVLLFFSICKLFTWSNNKFRIFNQFIKLCRRKTQLRLILIGYKIQNSFSDPVSSLLQVCFILRTGPNSKTANPEFTWIFSPIGSSYFLFFSSEAIWFSNFVKIRNWLLDPVNRIFSNFSSMFLNPNNFSQFEL